MNNLKIRSGLVSAALLLGCQVHAQATGWSAGLAGNLLTDSVTGITKHYGATVDGAYTWNNATAGLPLRLTLGYSAFPSSGDTGINGTAPSTYRIGLENVQLGLDAFTTLPTKKVRLYFGLTLNKWRVKSDSDYYVPDESEAGSHRESGSVRSSVPGIKLGVRLGLEMPFTDRLAGVLAFQAVELGTTSALMAPSDPNHSAVSGNGGVNPCWLQFGIRYQF